MDTEKILFEKIEHSILKELDKEDYYKTGNVIAIYRHGYYGHAWIPNDYNRDESDSKITFYYLAYGLSKKYKCVYFRVGDDFLLYKAIKNKNCKVVDSAKLWTSQQATFMIKMIKKEKPRIVFIDNNYLLSKDLISVVEYCKQENITIIILASIARTIAHKRIEQGYNARIEFRDINIHDQQKELNSIADYIFAIDYADCYQLRSQRGENDKIK